MEFIKKSDALGGSNSDNCKYVEYSFSDKDMDLGITTITGRYPLEGYCMNTISKELVYVLDGNGTIFFENEYIEFEKGDAVFILPNEKYYWDSNYCVVSLTCTSAWSEEQHLLIP